MPEPQSFEHLRRAMRWTLLSLFSLLLGGAIARQALLYAEANGIDASGQSSFVDWLLWVATAVTFLSVVPFYIALRALFAARRTYDDGYVRLWTAVTDEDNRRRYLEILGEEAFRKTGLRKPRTGLIFAPPVVPKTYSEMVYGKKETER